MWEKVLKLVEDLVDVTDNARTAARNRAVRGIDLDHCPPDAVYADDGSIVFSYGNDRETFT